MSDPPHRSARGGSAGRQPERGRDAGRRSSVGWPPRRRRRSAGLRGAHGDATWTGAAADAFRTQLGKLPGDLEKVHESYGPGGVRRSAPTAASWARSRASSSPLVSQLHSAQSAVTTAQGNLTTAKGNLTSATSAPHAKATSPSVVNAHNAVGTAGGAVTQAQGELSGLQQRAFHMLDEVDTVRGHARSAVSSAAGVAPSSGGWFSSMMHSIGNFMSRPATSQSAWSRTWSMPPSRCRATRCTCWSIPWICMIGRSWARTWAPWREPWPWSPPCSSAPPTPSASRPSPRVPAASWRERTRSAPSPARSIWPPTPAWWPKVRRSPASSPSMPSPWLPGGSVRGARG